VSCEIDHRQLLLASEALQPLPDVREAEALGIHAIARLKLTAPNARFKAYLAGFDGDDTFWGLVCAPHEIRLGRLYFSGLTVAWNFWGIPIQQDQQFKAMPLQRLVAETQFDVMPQPNTIVPFYDSPREIIRSRVCVGLAKEPHHFYNNHYQRGRY
jgi:hypothetical protein